MLLREEITEIQNELHSKLLTMRSIERILESEEFQEYYSKANEQARNNVKHFIKELKTQEIITWLTIQRRNHIIELGNLPVWRLRQIACKLQIPLYNYLPKTSLLSEIISKEQRNVVGTSIK